MSGHDDGRRGYAPTGGDGMGRGFGRGAPSRAPMPDEPIGGWLRPRLVRPGSNSPPGTRSESPPTAIMGRMGVAEDAAELRQRYSDVRDPEGYESRRRMSKERDMRGARRGARVDDGDYRLKTRPVELATKQGNKGLSVPMISNYFRLDKKKNWILHQYLVLFNPKPDIYTRKFIIRSKQDAIGGYLFNGDTLFTVKEFTDAESVFAVEAAEFKGDANKVFEITLKYQGVASTDDMSYVNLYSLLLRKCLEGMGLEELGRNYYDRSAEISIDSQRLALWPGYITTLRQHEDDVMLCVEITHKVLRLDNALVAIRSIESANRGDSKEAVLTELRSIIVMTSYDKKRNTYKIDDVDFNQTPMSTFPMGKDNIPTTYVDYYLQRYGQQIKDLSQPLLICRPTKRDFHRGDQKNAALIPELCQLTGLTEAMRANFTLMKELSKHLHMGPADRVKSINQFMGRLKDKADVASELEKWGLRFNPKMADVVGRTLPREQIFFAKGSEMEDDKADWTKAFRTQQMLTTVHMNKWAIIVPNRDASGVDNLVGTMKKVAGPLNMTIKNPAEVYSLPDTRPATYIKAMNTITHNHSDLQMLFVILPNNKLETYATVKRRLAVDLGIPSQCFVAKNVQSKGLMSIATKVVVQMNAKLGGEPWTVKIPLKNMMICGFDVYRGAKGSRGGTVGAMVASISPTFAKYYSTTTTYRSSEEISQHMMMDFTKCLHAYKAANNVLPDRIVMYRDGVGEGDLCMVYEVEVRQIELAMKEVYMQANLPIPKFTFIVVTKKINTRFFADSRGRYDNPAPGSIVDSVVTIPDRYDFFLVSCTARQGTVSPCSYNVLRDTQGLDPDKIQALTYKLCHMYFNWSGTVAVPAPCQYAHKLAFITGTAYAGSANEKLSQFLHFL